MRPYDWYEAGLFCAEDDPLFRVPELEVIREPWSLSFVFGVLGLLTVLVALAVAFALSLN